MSIRQSRRRHRGALAISAADKPASPVERAFAAFTVATMLLISAYMVLT